jgi:hypothetical protein
VFIGERIPQIEKAKEQGTVADIFYETGGSNRNLEKAALMRGFVVCDTQILW